MKILSLKVGPLSEFTGLLKAFSPLQMWIAIQLILPYGSLTYTIVNGRHLLPWHPIFLTMVMLKLPSLAELPIVDSYEDSVSPVVVEVGVSSASMADTKRSIPTRVGRFGLHIFTKLL